MKSLRTIIAIHFVFLAAASGAAQSEPIDQRLESVATLIRQNRIVEAERQLTAILKAAPKEARALNLLGTIRGSQGKFAEAETLFMRAIEIDSRLVAAHMNLAYLYVLKNEPDRTISTLRVVVGLEPNNSEAALKLARLLLSRGQIDECVQFIEESKASQSPTPALLTVLGDAYLRRPDVGKARESFQSALDKQGDSVEALLGMSQVFQVTGDNQSALLNLARAKQVLGTSADLHYRYAVLASKLGAVEESRPALEKAVKFNPDEPVYVFALGDAWLKKPDLLEAEKAFRRAVQLRPDDFQSQMYLGYTLLKLKNYTEAESYLEKSSKTDQNRLEPLYYLGLLAQDQSQDERAIGILEKLVQRFPTFAYGHAALGLSYMKLKDHARSRQELELAVKLDPNDAKAHYNLAVLYARLKEAKLAQEQMQIVEKLKRKGVPNESDFIAPSSLTKR